MSVLIKEQLIGKVLRLALAQDLANAVIDRRVGAVILAIHLEIDAKGRPARAKVRLPLQLHVATCHGQRHLGTVLIVKGDRSLGGIDGFHRHIHHPTGFRMDRQKDGIGLLAFVTQRLQHDIHDLIIFLGSPQQDLVELAGAIEFRGRYEFIFEPECVQKSAQHGVVMVPKAFELAEWIRHRGQRALQMLLEDLGVGHIARDLAHPVQIVGKADQLGWYVRDFLKGATDHAGAGHFAKGANMGQAGGAIAGLEQHETLFRRRFFVTFQHPARFFKRPGFARHRSVTQTRHQVCPKFLDRRSSAASVHVHRAIQREGIRARPA